MTTKNYTNATTMQVLKTSNYEMFKTLEGNRHLNTLHLNRLMTSMSEDYLVSPIIVNEAYEVIDGQHRLTCAKQLGLPIYYIVVKGYGLNEIHRYNANSKNWTMDDFLSGYIQLGKREYEFYKAFKDKYGFGHSETLNLLTGDHSSRSTKTFQEGKLRIKKYNEACVIAEKIKKIEPYYEGWKRRSFVGAVIHLIKNTDFDIDEFVDKLKFQRSKIYDCSKVEQYIAVIEDIYNFKRRGERKSFKYAA